MPSLKSDGAGLVRFRVLDRDRKLVRIFELMKLNFLQAGIEARYRFSESEMLYQ